MLKRERQQENINTSDHILSFIKMHFHLTDGHYRVKKRKKLFSSEVLYEAALFNLVAMTMQQKNHACYSRKQTAISCFAPKARRTPPPPPYLDNLDRSLTHTEAQIDFLY